MRVRARGEAHKHVCGGMGVQNKALDVYRNTHETRNKNSHTQVWNRARDLHAKTTKEITLRRAYNTW